MATCQVYTIGYEGREIDDFVDRLKKYNIVRLIDIREIPISRKRGFSKSILMSRLEAENIQYCHIRSLGSPATIRHKLREDHDYQSFFKAFNAYLENNKDALIEAYQLIKSDLSCIMCFERFPEKCHRSTVVHSLKEIDGNGMRISHI